MSEYPGYPIRRKNEGRFINYNFRNNNMMSVLKQVVGIDVAQKELVVTLGRTLGDFSIELYAHKVFVNSDGGIKALMRWVDKLTDGSVCVSFVMEATGVYHQKFAYYLDENGHDVSLILPNKISNYMRTLDHKTITDRSCSRAIAQFGLERKLDCWCKPKEVYRRLQQLTRERDQIVHERSMVKNQLHAEQSEADPYQKSIDRLKLRIALLNGQETEVKKDIEELISRDASLEEEINLITSIPGVGRLTATIVLAETNGFELIRSKKQLTSYAGLDVREKQSGTSVNGKSRISKKGNRSLRKAMYLPSLSAVKWDEQFKCVYTRIVSKSGVKMKGLVAVQRKMLEMIYTLYKSRNKYDKLFLIKENSAQIQNV
jgi:transposase